MMKVKQNKDKVCVENELLPCASVGHCSLGGLVVCDEAYTTAAYDVLALWSRRTSFSRTINHI